MNFIPLLHICALLMLQFKENLILSLSHSHTRDRVSTMLFTKKKNLLSCAKHFFFININSFSNVSREWVNETSIHVYNLTYTVKQLRATLFPYSKTRNANSLTNKKTLVSFLLSLSPVQNYWRKFNWKSSKKKKN